MTLATAGPDGRPSARTVLLKGFDAAGFTFHTNYDSRKGRELAANPHAALLFFWPELERQVRIEGTVARISEAESDDYFRTRPVGSRLSAWASRQSEPVADRAALERRMEELARQYPDGDVPRPPFWGGLRLRPETIEFGRAGRTGCMIGCAIGASRRRSGRSSGCRREGQAARRQPAVGFFTAG